MPQLSPRVQQARTFLSVGRHDVTVASIRPLLQQFSGATDRVPQFSKNSLPLYTVTFRTESGISRSFIPVGPASTASGNMTTWGLLLAATGSVDNASPSDLIGRQCSVDVRVDRRGHLFATDWRPHGFVDDVEVSA